MFSKGPRKLMPLVWGPHCELRQRMVCEPNPSFPVDGQFASALWIDSWWGRDSGGGGVQDSTFSKRATVLPRQIIHKPLFPLPREPCGN